MGRLVGPSDAFIFLPISAHLSANSLSGSPRRALNLMKMVVVHGLCRKVGHLATNISGSWTPHQKHTLRRDGSCDIYNTKHTTSCRGELVWSRGVEGGRHNPRDTPCRTKKQKSFWFNPKMAQPPQASTGDSACRNRRYRCSIVLTRQDNLSMCGTFSIRLLYSIEVGGAAGWHTRALHFSDWYTCRRAPPR